MNNLYGEGKLPEKAITDSRVWVVTFKKKNAGDGEDLRNLRENQKKREQMGKNGESQNESQTEKEN